MPEFREEHVRYTRKEWTQTLYFCNVIDFLKAKQIKSFMDIGSNVGEVANILNENVESLCDFYLIEPQKDNFLFLKENTKQIKNCKYFQFGIFYGKKEAELHQDPAWKNVGAFTVEVIQNQFKSTGEKIKLITLEECNFPIVDFVKIDVEGAEYNIIQNSEYIKKVPYIEVEFHKWDIDCIDFIKNKLPSHKICLYDPNLSNHLLLEKI